jgi:chromosome segregation ATPase
MQILVALGVGVVIYAVFGMFTSDNSKLPSKQRIQDQPLPEQDSGKEQKIQRLQSQIVKLESQLEQSKVASVEGKSGLKTIETKEAEFSLELKRREEWVAKAEAELAKARTENLDLNNKFMAKENELQEEFTKNVNLSRQIREIKSALEANEADCRLKEDQLQAQKHQSESQLKSINEHLATIAEFKRKEKISEWVPKQEFNQLNAEYTKLEKDLEASQERLKSFAAEIAHLRQSIETKVSPVEEIKLPEVIPEEITPVESAPEEISPQEAKPEEKKLAEGEIVGEIKAVEEGLEKKTEETKE